MAVSAKKIAAKIGATTIVGIVSWSVRESAVDLDATTAADAGYERHEAGLLGATIECRGVFDLTSGTYTPIKAGTTLTTLKLFSDVNDTTPAYSFGTAVVMESSQSGEIRGRFEMSFTAKSVGSWTYTEAGSRT